ncbi:hypothetical protein EQ826_11570 [Ectopseudomonas mendocina]|nr:hypothetical protein [Pseudomonas mendocina]TRO20587.1 hypothetical protein EQ828_15485 [Pseudomonas mendocina]TRO26216.1 hypothetical protein EQ826_11570 [Pseudomonas mendocina]
MSVGTIYPQAARRVANWCYDVGRPLCVVEITADLSAFGRIVCLSLLRFCMALLVIDPMSWQIHGEDRGFAIGYKVLRAPAVFRPARRMRKPKTKKPGHKGRVFVLRG